MAFFIEQTAAVVERALQVAANARLVFAGQELRQAVLARDTLRSAPRVIAPVVTNTAHAAAPTGDGAVHRDVGRIVIALASLALAPGLAAAFAAALPTLLLGPGTITPSERRTYRQNAEQARQSAARPRPDQGAGEGIEGRAIHVVLRA
jgi:hypothetical protein